MTNREFTATRTMLANAMATAGAELLQYMKTAGALAAIPDTDPQQYVVAGTPESISKLLPAVEPTSPAVQAHANLSIERIIQLHDENTDRHFGLLIEPFARAIEREVRSAAREQARNEAPEPEHMTTDESREYLVQFMEQHFTDKTFHRYIRADRVDRNRLAGDFAWQMARALRMILAAPSAAAPAAEEVQDQQQIEWSHDLQTRLMEAAQDIQEDEDARNLMAEAACLLAAMTGNAGAMKRAASTEGEAK